MDLGFTPQELGTASPSASPSPFVEDVAAESYVLQDAAFHSEEIQTLASKSLDFLAGISIPTVFKYFYPPVFIAVWAWLTSFVSKSRDFSQLASRPASRLWQDNSNQVVCSVLYSLHRKEVHPNHFIHSNTRRKFPFRRSGYAE